jgi:DNA-binding MarR family transcriptional regulator
MPDHDDGGNHLYSRAPRSSAALPAIAALLSLSRSTQEADERALRSLHMSALDARALLYVVDRVRRGAVVRPSDLAAVLHVTSAAITKLVDRLVHTGHLERQPNPRDRRGLVLVPTPRTTEELAEVYGHIHGPLIVALDELADEELEVIARFSSRFAAVLRQETRGQTPPPDVEG